MKLLKKIYLSLLGIFLLTGCQAGLEYEEVPESIYSEVGLGAELFTIKSREWFKDQIYAEKWNKWVDNYISHVTIGTGTGTKWTNNTGQTVTVGDIEVAPGKEVTLKGNIVTEELAGAPDGKLYVVNIYALSRVTHSTPTNFYYFDGSKFSGDFTLVNPTNNRSRNIILPTRKNELVAEMSLTQFYNCTVYPQDSAPILGAPGDFTQSPRYLVVNESRLPAGVERAKRLYELRITFLP